MEETEEKDTWEEIEEKKEIDDMSETLRVSEHAQEPKVLDKKEGVDYIKEIKRNQKDKKICIGMSSTKKRLFRDEIKSVYIASNCPKAREDDLKYYCSFHKIPIVKLEIPNDELGIVCRRQYSISVLSVLK